MCGVAGHIGVAPLPRERIGPCLELMRHRGPDHQASMHFRNTAGRHADLLHARLTIIDLDERANQPFRICSKVMIYNGELYNYVELRRELEARGRTFRTDCDTEVLLAAIDELGWGALDRFEGMYAFGVYDEADGSLTLVRDRFGEKPLYLYRHDGGLLFGSEAKFVSALLGRVLEPDFDQVHRYLVNGYKALYKEGSTFFRGLDELEAGSVLRVAADGSETSWRYWNPIFAPEDGMTYDEAVAGTRERLIRSVELRLRADVPLAFCMSGGVDSLSLISIAQRELGYDVHGFTIANSDERYEEQDMIDYAVAELGVRHTAIPLDTTEFLPRLRELVRHHDAPVYTITYFAHWLLMRSIHEHGYRISVSGTAADELFSGYYDHHLAYLREVAREPALHAASVGSWSEHIKPMTRNPFLGDPDLFVRDPGFRDHIYLDAEEFARYLRNSWHEPFRECRFTADVLRNRMLNELFYESVPVILHEDDLNAMYYSIENRSPFLDSSLADFSLTMPTRHLVRDGYAKAVLRDSMRGIVPPRILQNRRKVGFNAPILDFLDVADAEVRAELLDPASPIWEHVRREKIEQLLEKDFLPNSESKFLFYFTCAKLFLEEFA